MTVPLRFYDATQLPDAPCVSWSSPAKALALRRVMLRPAHGARAKSRLLRYRPCRRHRRDRRLAAVGRGSTPSARARHHAADRNRFRRAHRLFAVVGDPELLLHRAIAAPGAVGGAVADPGGGVCP